jgi:hypothetical protein
MDLQRPAEMPLETAYALNSTSHALKASSASDDDGTNSSESTNNKITLPRNVLLFRFPWL